MTALEPRLSLSRFVSRHCQNLFPWPHISGSLLIRLNTACPWQRKMSHFWLNLPAVLWQRCHPLRFWCLFSMESDPCIIYICRIWTRQLSLVQLSYLLTAYVPPLMDHPNLTCSIVDSELNFRRMITPTSVQFCHLNSHRALDWPTNLGIVCPSTSIGTHWMPVSRHWLQPGFSIILMKSWSPFEILIPRSFHQINMPHRLRMSKPLSVELLPHAFLIVNVGYRQSRPTLNSPRSETLLPTHPNWPTRH